METARDIALVLLSVEALAIGLLPLLLLAALAYGVFRLRRWMVRFLRGLTRRLQGIRQRVEGITAKIVAPIIAVRSRKRQLATIGHHVARMVTGR